MVNAVLGVVWRGGSQSQWRMRPEVLMLTRKGGSQWDSMRLSCRGWCNWVALSIGGGLNGWGVILSLVRGGYLLPLEDLGGQRDLARLHGGGSEVCG